MTTPLPPTPPAMFADEPAAFQVPAALRLSRNPQLPQHPLGAFTDAQYEAQAAQLRAEIARRYNDVLGQLGYVDEQGNFIPGTTEIEANRQNRDLQKSTSRAAEDVTHEMQRNQTLFSGYRGTQEARATDPFATAMADLQVDTPRKLSDLYSQAGDLVSEYNLRHNSLLADAATRQAAGIIAQPGALAPAGGYGGAAAPAAAPPGTIGSSYPTAIATGANAAGPLPISGLAPEAPVISSSGPLPLPPPISLPPMSSLQLAGATAQSRYSLPQQRTRFIGY